MAKKTREPARLGHADYCKWFEQMIGFKEDRVADGTWPDHLDEDFQALFDELWDAWDTYDRLNNELKKTTYKAYDDASKPVYNRLVSLRELIPTLFEGDDSVLGEFGLARKVPRDKEDLFTMASGCLEHWNDLVDGGLPSEYDPVEPMFDEFSPEYDAFEATYTAYIAKTRDVEEAQNLLIEKRELCHKKERLIFHWFKGLHMDGKAEWWTATLWGTISGGGGGEPEPGGEVPEIPDAPEGVYANFSTTPVVHILVGCGPYGEHTGFDIRKAETGGGVAKEPVMPDTNHATNINADTEPLMDTAIQPGKKYWYWVRARNGEEVGDWSEVVWAEYK